MISKNHQHLPRPSAYLWGRCEGWAKIGVYHAVVVDAECGEVLDEKENILLLRGADGMWIGPQKEGGMRFDKCAVTHLPVDPGTMDREGWLEKLAERNVAMGKRADESAKVLKEKRIASRRTNLPEAADGQKEFFDDKSEDKPV